MKSMFDLILSRNTPEVSRVRVIPETITLELGAEGYRSKGVSSGRPVPEGPEEKADGIHLHGATLQGIADAIELARTKQFRRVYVHTTR
jgi:hypothetical protein